MSEIQTALRKLGDSNRPVSHRDLRDLSDVGTEAEAEVLGVWRGIKVDRRRAIVQAMAELAEDNVEFDFRDVLVALLTDEDAQVRHTAVDGLWEDERPRTMRRLLDLLRSETESDVLAAVVLVLGRFAYRAELGELRPDDAATLRAALLAAAAASNQDLAVRRRAVESAGYFQGSEITELIAQAYGTGQQPLKESAIAAIGHNLDQRWLPVLQTELRSPQAALRYEAARAAGEFGEDATSLLPLLLPLAEGDDSEVALATVWALGQIGGPNAERLLKRLSDGNESALQQAAEEALSELHFNEDAGRLI